jgi:hypothetical protein
LLTPHLRIGFDDAYNMNPRRILPFSYTPFPVFLEPYILPDFELSRQHTRIDDYVEQSSQWDGFRHYSQPRNPKDSSKSQDRVFYGGTTKDEILDSSNHRIGMQHWAPQGIAGEFSILSFSYDDVFQSDHVLVPP